MEFIPDLLTRPSNSIIQLWEMRICNIGTSVTSCGVNVITKSTFSIALQTYHMQTESHA